MIAIDTSAFIAYLQNHKTSVTNLVDEALKINNAAIPSIVLTELLSDPKLPNEIRTNLSQLPLLEPKTGFWIRAGLNRAIILEKKLKARLADTLIMQICIDNNVALLTLDKDFKHFAKYCGLKLIET